MLNETVCIMCTSTFGTLLQYLSVLMYEVQSMWTPNNYITYESQLLLPWSRPQSEVGILGTSVKLCDWLVVSEMHLGC